MTFSPIKKVSYTNIASAPYTPFNNILLRDKLEYWWLSQSTQYLSNMQANTVAFQSHTFNSTNINKPYPVKSFGPFIQTFDKDGQLLPVFASIVPILSFTAGDGRGAEGYFSVQIRANGSDLTHPNNSAFQNQVATTNTVTGPVTSRDWIRFPNGPTRYGAGASVIWTPYSGIRFTQPTNEAWPDNPDTVNRKYLEVETSGVNNEVGMVFVDIFYTPTGHGSVATSTAYGIRGLILKEVSAYKEPV